jgi:GTPase SAR1 family protein
VSSVSLHQRSLCVASVSASASFCHYFHFAIGPSLTLCNSVKENSAHTIGVEFSSRTMRIGDRNIKLQVGDPTRASVVRWRGDGDSAACASTHSVLALGHGWSGAFPIGHAIILSCVDSNSFPHSQPHPMPQHAPILSLILSRRCSRCHPRLRYHIVRLRVHHPLAIRPIRLCLLTPHRRQSFVNLGKWLTDCRALASPHLVTVLVGNKLDREEDREVEYVEGSRWAQENGEASWGVALTCRPLSLRLFFSSFLDLGIP